MPSSSMNESELSVFQRRRNVWTGVFAIAWIIAIVELAVGIPTTNSPLVAFLWITFAIGFVAAFAVIYYEFRLREEPHDT